MADVTRRRILTAGAIGAAGLVTTLATSPVQASPQNPSELQANANLNGRFGGKVVLITGATSGIGEVTAKAFAREGAQVFFCGRRENLGQEVEAAIRDMGGEATYMRADVRQAEEVEAFVDACVAKYGRLDIAYNNAGIDYPPNPITDTSTEEFDDLMNTNARGFSSA